MSAKFDQEVPTPPDSERGRPRRPRWRSLRLAAGGLAAATALSVAVPSMASALPIPEQGSAANHAPGSAAHRGRVVLPLMSGRAGDSDAGCVPPTFGAARKWGSRRSSGARLASSQRVAGTSGKLGADEEGTVVDYLLQSLKDNAVAYAEDGGFGWALSLLSGQQPSIDQAEIDTQFAQVDSQLNNLSNAQYQDCQAIENTLTAIEQNSDHNTYSTMADSMDAPITHLNTARGYYDDIVKDLYASRGNANALSDDDKAKIVDLLPGGNDDLHDVINNIIANEGAVQPGANDMVQYYGKVLTDQYGYDPYKSHIFPAAFVNDGYAQQEFYASLLTQALFIYANVAHLTFTYQGAKHTPDPQSIIDLVNTAQAGIASWSAEFSDGPSGDGTANWVSQGKNQGIGALPADTVLDYRVQNRPMLWTTAPVNLSTGTSSSTAPYYCGTTAQFCYAATYAITGSPLPPHNMIGDLQLAAPSPQPLPALIEGANYDGMTGWRVPTLSDWTALKAGATGGLSTWGPANQLPMFTPQKVTTYWQGMGVTIPVIAPMLYATSGSSQPYGVLTSPQPANDNSLSQVPPPSGPSGESDQAGRLFLVQDFQPASGSAPSSVGTHLAQASHAPGTHTTASHPAAAHVPAAHGTGVRVYNRSQAPQADLAPVKFSPPAFCSANSSGDTYTVPAGAGTVQVTATGGAGASGTNHDGTTDAGGRGGSVTETFPVTSGQTLYVQVGGAAHGQTGGVGGGADGGATSSVDGASGGGGGASGVSTGPDCSNWLVVAGGGGGGGAGGYLNPDVGPSTVLPGGDGGDGCAMTGGSCAVATAGHPLGGDEGGAGGMPPHNVGGTAASGTPASSAGSPGANMAGGAGGAGGDAAYGFAGGGGGGGGAGYFGGGGGGAAGKNESGEGPGGGAAGGGGGGGASFAIPGGSDISYSLGDGGQDGSVTITPLAPAPPKVSVSASTSDTTWGQPVTLTATVPASATGTVTFTDGGQALGTATILDGTATLATPATLGVGSHQIVASYNGSTSYTPSQSAPVTVTVGKANPAMALTINGTSTSTTLSAGQQPTSLVVQMPADATGSVGFYDDINGGCEGSTAPGAKCQGEGVAPIVNGYATLTSVTVPLTDGVHYLHASYGGDGHYNPNGSSTVTVTIGSASATRPATHHGPAKHHPSAKH